jgi:hypothetical protein
MLLGMAVFLCSPFLSAQAKPAADRAGQTQPPPASAATPVKVPDVSKEGLVLEKVYTRIRMEADGTGVKQISARTHVLADSGVKEMAVLAFTYTASNEQVDIGYIRVIKPSGAVVVTPDYNIQDMPADVTRAAPMYSDIHQKHVAVKGLGVGDVIESQVTYRTFKPEVPGQFWLEYTFEKNLIILDEQFDLDLPAEKAVTVASADLQPAVTTSGGRKLYHWASSNLARPDPDDPPKSLKHWKPSVQVTTFTSWEQVGAWYRSLQTDPLTVTPAIQAKAAALTKGLTTDEEKVHAIFNDVALHIHYVGLEFGIGRYQPHPADDVLSNEYGDCKDKHTLLASLLKAVGIEAWPVLISSNHELDPATPSPSQFSHVITLVPLDGKLLWMDSTEEVVPIGVLAATLRDKQALAIPPGKPAYLERTPADLPFAGFARFQAEGALSDQGAFTAHIVQTYHGDVEPIFRAAFREVPQSQWKELVQRISRATGFGGEVKNPEASEVEKTGLPFRFSYDYTREKYGEWDDHRITPPMPPMGGELAPGVKEKKPADEPELGSPGESLYQTTVQLPKGWTLLPAKNTDLKEDWAEYHSTYSFNNGVYTAERRLQVKKNKVPLAQWEKYLDFRRAIYQDEVQTAMLVSARDAQDFQKRIDAQTAVAPHILQGQYAGVMSVELKDQLMAAMQPLRDATAILESAAAPSASDLAKATGLARKAVDDIEARTLTLPGDDAHSLYWSQLLAYGWSTLGWAALESKDLPTAETYLRAAWRLGQDKMSGYQLARLLEAKGDKAAAAHLYELANISSVGNSLGGFLYSDYKVQDRIPESYKKLTGNPLTATALNHGQYNGSLRAELDKEIEIHGFTKVSKLDGQGLFALAYEAGKPAKALLLNGDKGFATMAGPLEAHKFPVALPSGSKARLLREVRLICSSYGGGCDAYMLLPTSIQIPPTAIKPPNAPPGTKTVQIEVAP